MQAEGTAIPDNIVEIWQRLVDQAAALLDVPSVMVNKLEPPDLEVFRSNADPDNPLPTGTCLPMMGLYCEAAAKRRERVMVRDARRDPAWSDSPTAKAGIYAYLGYPIMWPDGQVFGTLCAVDTEERRWSERDEGLLMAFKDAIEAHLALARATELLERKNAELEVSLREVKTLRGILPICASCKRIRDDQGHWQQVESYVRDRSEARFSHSLCPECAKRLYPGIELSGTSGAK
jgi:GAF domain-containing protein